MEVYSNLVEAINGLKKLGYEKDFKLEREYISCAQSNSNYYPIDFSIDQFHRFDDMSNLDDSSIIYAISSSNGSKGVLISAYGTYAEELSMLMIKKLNIKER